MGMLIIVKLSGKTVGIIVLSIVGALVLCLGMCMTMIMGRTYDSRLMFNKTIGG